MTTAGRAAGRGDKMHVQAISGDQARRHAVALADVPARMRSAIVAAATVLVAPGGRWCADRRLSWIAAVVALHAMVVSLVLLWPGEGGRTVADAVRLAGFGVSLAALFCAIVLVGKALAGLRAENFELQDEMRIAAVAAQRANDAVVERDHEIRNGLSGLAGVIDTLVSGSGNREHEWLRAAVRRELARLSAMVDGPPAPAPQEGFDVGDVLFELAALRRAGGVTVTLDCPPGLRATGTVTTFVQVMTNVLANCTRHAPGAPVSIRSSAVDSMIVVEVADAGPGLPPGLELMAVASGVRSSITGGQGLGLHISSNLLASEGGRLRLLPTAPGRSGCTVVVELPRPEPAVNPAATKPEVQLRRAIWSNPRRCDPRRAPVAPEMAARTR